MIRRGFQVALHTGASDDVADTSTAVGTVKTNGGAEQLIVRGVYTKGTEDGLYIKVIFPRTITDTTEYCEPQMMDVGAGVLIHYPQIFRLDVTGPYELPISIRGRPFFKVLQYKVGGVASGTFTCTSELYFGNE